MKRPQLQHLWLPAAIWLGACFGGPASGPAVCPQPPDPAARIGPAPTGVGAGDAASGELLFMEHCQRCHSHDVAQRESRVFRKYPRLDCRDWLATTSDDYLWTAIAGGGIPIQRKEVMKPFSEVLSPREISDVIAYLRRAQRPGAD